ncbi:diversity-generating retroelement protein bAvd family protein [Aliifodinibius salipaludis]|uniref:Diversity-generating retroelement protein bAvd family protein n=1 Tax=Fodinibius salipaludis TaxID=2032627 RepID=A0A2A2GCH8_9BACT|nr:four helix bundle protein [Aliifodinibius salipaludis]PAU95251.1 diversity-generating retroelement protein bAvd family protein [Aliifodinibius salipaludis]
MKNFRNLKIWEKSHSLTLDIYKFTSSYPKEELYGLISQMRRSSASIPSNIAEGCGRNTQPQLARFLNIAFGSASELEYQLILSKDLEFIDKKTFKILLKKVTEIKRMLASLLKKVQADS